MFTVVRFPNLYIEIHCSWSIAGGTCLRIPMKLSLNALVGQQAKMFTYPSSNALK
jgi:hypothetical protein